MFIASKYDNEKKPEPIKFKTVLEKLLDISIIKTFFMAFLGLVGGFVAPIWAFIIGSFALVLIDYFTGKKAARKRREPITSIGMRRSIDKSLIYMSFIIAAHIVDVVFSVPYDPLSYIAALAVARVEFFSIDENVRQLTEVSIVDHIQDVFTFTKKK